MDVQIPFPDPIFNSFGYTVDPWTTWVWTVLVHLCADFFNKYYSSTRSAVDWFHRCGTVDTEKLEHPWIVVSTAGPGTICCRHLETTVYPEELLDLMVILFLIWGGTVIPFSVAAAPFYFPSKSVQGFQLFTHSCQHLFSGFFFFFNSSHPNGCEVVTTISLALLSLQFPHL